MKCPKICPYEWLTDKDDSACTAVVYSSKEDCDHRLLYQRLQRAMNRGPYVLPPENLYEQWQKELNRNR